MAAKLSYAYAVSGKTGSKKEVLEVLTGLQALPQHKWIPIEEMQSGKQATITARQADWIAAQVASKVEGAEITFEPIAVEVEAEG